MTSEQYQKISEPFRQNPGLLNALKICNRFCTGVGFVTYPVLIGYLLLQRDLHVILYILIPGISFVLLSWFRRQFNANRPYEQLDIVPLIPKQKKGRSFPSRHVFSIFVIAGCWYGICYPIGIIVSICGVFLALVRVIGGIHFPKDVIWGAILGIIFGLLSTIIASVCI